MTKVKRKSTRKLPSNSLLSPIHEIEQTKPNRTTTTTATSQPTLQNLRRRKCVVKIKRIKLPKQHAASHKPDTPRKLRRRTVRDKEVPETPIPTAQLLEADDQDHDVTSFEPTRNSTMSVGLTPAAVQSTRIKNTPGLQLETLAKRTNKQTALKDAREPTEKRVQKPRKCTAKKATITPELTKEATTVEKSQTTEIQAEKQTAAMSKRGQRFFHRMQPPVRTRSEVTRNVYEYLSESEINDNELNQHQDPAADIIKKMLEDGKVCAMMRLKTGRMRKRATKNKVRPVGKRRQCVLKSVAKKAPNEVKEVEQAEIAAPREQEYVQPNLTPNKQTMVNGGYSPLACSLFLNPNKTATDLQKRRRQLLDMARQFVSTPINRKTETRHNTKAISPIVNQTQAPPAASVRSSMGSKSTGRVTEEFALSNRNVFGPKTSSSYSRGNIIRKHVYVSDVNDNNAPESESIGSESFTKSLNDGNDKPTDSQLGQSVQLTELSRDSFVNDSNGENLPPPSVADFASADQQHEDAENYMHLPNPRRTLQHRSPLKDINILDVVVLPSWKKNVQPAKTPTRPSMASNISPAAFNSPNSPNQQTPARKKQAELSIRSPGNLFGFEEFLTDNESGNENTFEHQNTTLCEKLQRVRQLRPTVKELLSTSKAFVPEVYDSLSACKPKQRNIKDMLCSTMIAKALPSQALDETAGLFSNPDPEVTFDEKQPRHTYVRERPKRRRKQRVHVLFIDTDSSEDEDKEQDSSESPKKLMPAHKRLRKDVENEHRLQQFVTSFNQECEEIEKYTPIIE